MNNFVFIIIGACGVLMFFLIASVYAMDKLGLNHPAKQDTAPTKQELEDLYANYYIAVATALYDCVTNKYSRFPFAIIHNVGEIEERYGNTVGYSKKVGSAFMFLLQRKVTKPSLDGMPEYDATPCADIVAELNKWLPTKCLAHGLPILPVLACRDIGENGSINVVIGIEKLRNQW